jgi:Domain of unknown function (DUF6484)
MTTARTQHSTQPNEAQLLETDAGSSWEVLFGASTGTGGPSGDALLAAISQRPQKLDGVLIGKLIGMDEGGEALVDFAGNPCAHPLPARSTVACTARDAGRDVVLLFERGDPHRPIVMGLLHTPRAAPPVQAETDGERLVFTAEKEIVLRCGGASITLTRAGKVIIRGAYLLSRSSGVNRIKGGSVQIN